MLKLLEDAVSELRKLPDVEQEAIAALILAEIDDERRWDESFARSSDRLKALADRADEQVRNGRCRSVGFDEL